MQIPKPRLVKKNDTVNIEQNTKSYKKYDSVELYSSPNQMNIVIGDRSTSGHQSSRQQQWFED